MKSLLLGLLLASGANAAVQDVNVTNTFLNAKQYGIWGVTVNNFPANYSVTQGGLFSVNQNGVWNVGQYGPWSVSLAPGTTVTVAAGLLTVTTSSFLGVSIQSSVALTVTAASPLPVSIVAGAVGGSVLAVSATTSIPFIGGTSNGQVVFSNGMYYDGVAGIYKQLRAANTADPTSSNAHPGSIAFGVYNAITPIVTNGLIARHQMDMAGNLMVNTRSGVFNVDARGSSVVAFQGGSPWAVTDTVVSGLLTSTNALVTNSNAFLSVIQGHTTATAKGTDVDPMSVSSTVSGVGAGLSTTVQSRTALNVFAVNDTYSNTKLASGVLRLPETTTFFSNTSGIQSIFASGYGLLYNVVVEGDGAGTAGNLTFFSGTVTKTVIALGSSAPTSFQSSPMPFTSGMVVSIDAAGGGYDGNVTIQYLQ